MQDQQRCISCGHPAYVNLDGTVSTYCLKHREVHNSQQRRRLQRIRHGE